MKRAGAGNTSGKYLCALRDELSELSNVFIIDIVYLILTEDANLLSSVHGAVSGALCVISFHLDRPFTFPTHFFYISLAAVSLAVSGETHVTILKY